MYFKKTWIAYIMIMVIIISITYIQATIYIPFSNVVKVEKIVEQNTKLVVEVENSNSTSEVTDESSRVKIHNIFNDLEVSRDFFVTMPNEAVPSYNIKLEYVNSDNKEVVYVVRIIGDNIISINGDTFNTSRNIYNDVKSIVTTLE